MPILTLEAISRDPWNAVAYEMPVDASHELLLAAFRAARDCGVVEYLRMINATIAPSTTLEDDSWQVHAYHDERLWQVSLRLQLIAELLNEFYEVVSVES